MSDYDRLEHVSENRTKRIQGCFGGATFGAVAALSGIAKQLIVSDTSRKVGVLVSAGAGAFTIGTDNTVDENTGLFIKGTDNPQLIRTVGEIWVFQNAVASRNIGFFAI